MKIAAIIGIIMSLLALSFFLGALWTVLLVILYIFLGLIALLLLILLVVLFCRLDYIIDLKKADKDAPFEYSATIIWLLGGFRKKFDNKDKEADVKPSKDKAEKPKKTEKTEDEGPQAEKKDKKGFGQTLKEIDFDKLKIIAGHTWELIKRIFVIVRPKYCKIRGRFGAPEPDITGKVFAFVGVAASQLNIDAQIEGNFEEPDLAFDIKIAGCMRLWSILLPAIRYILKPEIRRFILERLRRRRKAKKLKRKMLKNKNNQRKGGQNGDRAK